MSFKPSRAVTLGGRPRTHEEGSVARKVRLSAAEDHRLQEFALRRPGTTVGDWLRVGVALLLDQVVEPDLEGPPRAHAVASLALERLKAQPLPRPVLLEVNDLLTRASEWQATDPESAVLWRTDVEVSLQEAGTARAARVLEYLRAHPDWK